MWAGLARVARASPRPVGRAISACVASVVEPCVFLSRVGWPCHAKLVGATCPPLAKVEGWWAGRDSNPQPKHYECSALTIELPARLK